MRIIYQQNTLEDLNHKILCPKCGEVNQLTGSDHKVKCSKCGKLIFATPKVTGKLSITGPRLVSVPFDTLLPEELQAYVVKGVYTDGSPIIESVSGAIRKDSIIYIGDCSITLERININSVSTSQFSTPLRLTKSPQKISGKLLKRGKFVEFKGFVRKNTIYLPN